MLTIFTTPKPFHGHNALIQRNAIRSWTCLRPSCEVLLFGDDEGVAETAEEFGVRHVPSVAKNEYGTPLLDDMFAQAARVSANGLLACVNADIILMSDFMRAVEQVASWRERFLMVGQRRNIEINEPLSFDPRWEQRLRKLVLRNGDFYFGIDYFVYPRNLWREIPPFAVGRLTWDNWILYGARLRKAAVVDTTPVVLAVHQNHEHIKGLATTPEAKRNWDLLGGGSNLFTTWETTHVLTPQGLKVRCRSCYPMCVCRPE